MKKISLVIVVLAMVAALVLLNKGINQTAQSEGDDASAPATKTTPPKAASPPSSTGNSRDATNPLAPETMVGSPMAASHRISVGWVYDEANQADPTALIAALQAVRKYGLPEKKIFVEIVDLDVPTVEFSPMAGMVSGLGVTVDGKSQFTVQGHSIDLSDNPGEGMTTADKIDSVLAQTLR